MRSCVYINFSIVDYVTPHLVGNSQLQLSYIAYDHVHDMATMGCHLPSGGERRLLFLCKTRLVIVNKKKVGFS